MKPKQDSFYRMVIGWISRRASKQKNFDSRGNRTKAMGVVSIPGGLSFIKIIIRYTESPTSNHNPAMHHYILLPFFISSFSKAFLLYVPSLYTYSVLRAHYFTPQILVLHIPFCITSTRLMLLPNFHLPKCRTSTFPFMHYVPISSHTFNYKLFGPNCSPPLMHNQIFVSYFLSLFRSSTFQLPSQILTQCFTPEIF